MKRKPTLGVGQGMGIGVAAVLCAALAGPVWSQSCDLQVRDGSAAADIGRIHRCLNDRLNRLESRLDAAGTGGVTSGGAPAQRNVSDFDAGSFTLSVVSAKRQRQNVSVLFSVVNKTTQNIYVALDYNQGQFFIDESSASTEAAVNATGIASSSGKPRLENFSLIPAGSRLSFTVLFRFNSNPGGTGSLTMNLFEYAEKATDSRRVTATFRVPVRD